MPTSANGYASIARSNSSATTALEANANVIALYALADGDVKPVDVLSSGQSGVVILDRTPFYAESGGQIGDTGVLKAGDAEFTVTDTTLSGRQHLHRGVMGKGALRVGSNVVASVESERRRLTALNHSATHLLHAALRRVLGSHVQQKGSLVSPRASAVRLRARVANDRD